MGRKRVTVEYDDENFPYAIQHVELCAPKFRHNYIFTPDQYKVEDVPPEEPDKVCTHDELWDIGPSFLEEETGKSGRWALCNQCRRSVKIYQTPPAPEKVTCDHAGARLVVHPLDQCHWHCPKCCKDYVLALRPTPPAPEPLKPCWNCRSEMRISRVTVGFYAKLLDPDAKAWAAVCECGVQGPSKTSEAEARAAWNRRTP